MKYLALAVTAVVLAACGPNDRQPSDSAIIVDSVVVDSGPGRDNKAYKDSLDKAEKDSAKKAKKDKKDK